MYDVAVLTESRYLAANELRSVFGVVPQAILMT